MAGAMPMMRSGVLLALLTLTLMVSQASDVPFPPSSDAPAGLLVARSATKAVVSRASGLTVPSPLTSDNAPAGLASKEGEAVVPPGEHIPGDGRANASSAPQNAETAPTHTTERVVLILANTFSLMLSLAPFFLRRIYGSWHITRAIFPAKGVAVNFIASGAWTVYVILEMYAENNYAGLEALMVNCLTIGTNLVTLIIYFLHAKEYKKFLISSLVFFALSWGGLVWLVFHPNSIGSHTRKVIFRKDTELFGVIGIILFIIMNGFPFVDLLAMTTGGRNDFFPLLVPIMVNNFMNVVAGGLWTVYAYFFGSQTPRLFMAANIIATSLTIIQTLWIGYILKHKEMNGLITEVESLRSVLISVSSSLGRYSTAPASLWYNSRFISRLHESLKTGVLSLVLLENTFRRLEADLHAALEVPDVVVQSYQRGALQQYPTLLAACQDTINAIDAFERAIRDRLYGVAPLHPMQEMDALKIGAMNASDAMLALAECLRPSMQVINTAQGIPLTAQFAFDCCRDQLFIIKTTGHCCPLRLPCT